MVWGEEREGRDNWYNHIIIEYTKRGSYMFDLGRVKINLISSRALLMSTDWTSWSVKCKFGEDDHNRTHYFFWKINSVLNFQEIPYTFNSNQDNEISSYPQENLSENKRNFVSDTGRTQTKPCVNWNALSSRTRVHRSPGYLSAPLNQRRRFSWAEGSYRLTYGQDCTLQSKK